MFDVRKEEDEDEGELDIAGVAHVGQTIVKIYQQ